MKRWFAYFLPNKLTNSPLIAAVRCPLDAPQRLFHVLFSRRAGEPASPAPAWWLPRARGRRS